MSVRELSLVIAGMGLGAAAATFRPTVTSNGIAIGPHDTLGIAYAIPTDTILGVTRDGTNRIYCRNVGISSFRVRLYRGKAPNPPTAAGAVVGDTITIGCGTDTTRAPFRVLITCNAYFYDSLTGYMHLVSPQPSCHDTTRSVPGWKTGAPCAWTQVTDSTVACLLKPAPPTIERED